VATRQAIGTGSVVPPPAQDRCPSRSTAASFSPRPWSVMTIRHGGGCLQEQAAALTGLRVGAARKRAAHPGDMSRERHGVRQWHVGRRHRRWRRPPAAPRHHLGVFSGVSPANDVRRLRRSGLPVG